MTNISRIDPSTHSIVDEPYTDGRARPISKYEAVFSQLKPGQRLRCPDGTASRLSAQLKKWLASEGHKGAIVRARERCDDGQGGVWWMLPEQKPKTVWQGLRKAA